MRLLKDVLSNFVSTNRFNKVVIHGTIDYHDKSPQICYL